MNVLLLNLEMEYQMHLLQMEFAMMKQIPLTVGLMDLIVVDQLSLRITALNVLVLIVSIFFVLMKLNSQLSNYDKYAHLLPISAFTFRLFWM